MDPNVLPMLSAIGLRADPSWALANATAGLPANAVAQRLFDASISCDLKKIVSEGSLPSNLSDAPEVLSGPFLLQTISAEDVSVPKEFRSNGGGGINRALKFVLTDGRQDVLAFEWRHLPAVPSVVPPGSKFICKNVPLRHGLLLLAPENTLYVGGGAGR